VGRDFTELDKCIISWSPKVYIEFNVTILGGCSVARRDKHRRFLPAN